MVWYDEWEELRGKNVEFAVWEIFLMLSLFTSFLES